jgi:hypothetical protein
MTLDHAAFSPSFGFPTGNTVEEGNTEHLSAFNIILKILRNIYSVIFFHRRAYEKFYFRYQ